MRRLIVVWLILSSAFVGSAFAQNECTTCGSPAQLFVDYTDFVNQVLWSIQAVWWEWSSLWRNVVPWLFQSQVLNFPTQEQNAIQRWLQRTARSINQAAQASLSTSYVLLSDAVDMVWFDGFLGMAILFQWQAIVRDWATLQKLDSKIQDKNFALGAAAWWFQTISDADMAQIKQHFNEASTKAVFSNFRIDDTATYADLLTTLKTANNMMKWFLSVNSITALSREIPQPADSNTHAPVWIQFNVASLEAMKTAYICARAGDKCSGNFKWFADSIKNLSKQNINGAKNALGIMTKSLSDLVHAFGGGKWGKVDKKLKVKYDPNSDLSKQDQLLRALYGSDYKKIQDGKGLWVQDIQQLLKWEPITVKNQWSVSNPFADLSRKSYGDAQKETLSYQTIADNTNTSISDLVAHDKVLDNELAFKNDSKDYKETMVSRFDQVADDIGQMIHYQDGLTQENYDVTLYIPKLALQLQSIRDLIGTKDTQWMLLYNLGKACELQCQNKWGTCRY